MKTPITVSRLKQHFAYTWWRYAVLVILALVGWNLLYTMTAYRPPEDKKVEVYVLAYGDQEGFDGFLSELHQKYIPDMELVDSVFMTNDETYGTMQTTVYLYAGEGDLYILTKDEYQSYASQGAFLELEEHKELMAVCEELGIDLTKGWRRNNDSGERHLYGIPIDQLPGFNRYFSVESGTCVSIMVRSGNQENAETLLIEMLKEMAKDPALENTEGATK